MRRHSLLLVASSSLLLAACSASAPKSADAPEASGGYAQPGYPQQMAAPPVAATGDASGARMATATEMPSGIRAPAASAASIAGPAPESAKSAVATTSFAGVKAGEWDDNANFRDFLGYIKGASSNIEKMDVSVRRFVVVQDKDGNGVPSCKVTVTDPVNQKTATLMTAASGRAVLFPRMFGMYSTLTASTTCLSQSATSVTFDATEVDGAVQLKLPVARPDVSKPSIDVVFVLDTTGSMSEEIEGVKSTLKTVLAKLDSNVQIRVGLVEYKDQGDTFVTKTYPLTKDIKSLSSSIAEIEASGGGDTPEDVNSGLSVAMTQMQWNPNATSRLAFLIADAPPHLDYPNVTPYSASAKRAVEKGIKVFTVAASGMDAMGQAVFRQVAQVTGGTNMFVLRGGAGPQSTGGGDPTSSCGKTHENYSSGNLDQLIVSKLNLEVTSLKADPMRIPGLSRDENAKACSDRVLIVAR